MMLFEENVALSDVIVRVKFTSVKPNSEQRYSEELSKIRKENIYYLGSLEFNFEVLEYLKGRGGKDIVVFLLDGRDGSKSKSQTLQEARAKAEKILTEIDPVWENKEGYSLFDELPRLASTKHEN